MSDDYKSVQRKSLIRRAQLFAECDNNPEAQALQKVLCARDVVQFISDWGITYDPRLVTDGGSAYIPFDLFPRQVEFLRWLDERVRRKEEGLMEKSRGVGFTWLAGAYAIHRWLFFEGFLTSFGSRKEELVDKIGDTKSIFEKMRIFLYRLPPWFLPIGFDRTKHDNHMRLTAPDTGNTITGEAGENMGRGARASCYVIDEAAFIDHGEAVEAAVSDTADVKIWASTVNGQAGVFARKRHEGGLRPDQIFSFHWTSDPRRTQEWAEKRKAELSSTPWIWYSEYELDYSASVEGICIPGAWIQAAKELGQVLPLSQLLELKATTPGIAGFDIGDGVARSVYQPRFGPLITPSTSWIRPDTTTTALEGLRLALEQNVSLLNFDQVGVGKGVLSTMSHLPDEAKARLVKDSKTGQMVPSPQKLAIAGINVGNPAPWQTFWPDGQSSRQKFANLKAELWGIMRERFHASYEHLMFIKGMENGKEHDLDDTLIFLPASPLAEEGYRDPYRELIVQLGSVKKFANAVGKIIMESKQQLATRGVMSPDYAEALSLTFANGNASAAHDAQQPIIAERRTSFPELSGDFVPSDSSGGNFEPAVPGIGRFDRDFTRDW